MGVSTGKSPAFYRGLTLSPPVQNFFLQEKMGGDENEKTRTSRVKKKEKPRELRDWWLVELSLNFTWW